MTRRRRAGPPGTGSAPLAALILCAQAVCGAGQVAVLPPSASPVCPDYSQPLNRTFSFVGTTWMLPAAGCQTFALSDPGSTPGGFNFYWQVRQNGCSTFTTYVPLINSKASAAAGWDPQINLNAAQCPRVVPGAANFFTFVINATATQMIVNSTLYYTYVMRQKGYNVSALAITGTNVQPTSDLTVCQQPSPTPTATASGTRSPNATGTATGTATQTATLSVSATAAPTAAATSSPGASPSVTAAETVSASSTPTGTLSATPTVTATGTATPTSTGSLTAASSASATPSGEPPVTQSAPATPSVLVSPSSSSSASAGMSGGESLSGTAAPGAAVAGSSDGGGGVAPIAGAIAGVAILGGAVAAVLIMRHRRARAASAVSAAPKTGGGGSGGLDRSASNPMVVVAGTASFRSPLAHAPGHTATAAAQSSARTVPTVAATGSSPWIEAFSKSKQMPYWKHAVTGEATWTRPTEVAPATAPVTAGDAPLPAGWTQNFSRSKQLPYWRHSSGETTWTRPT